MMTIAIQAFQVMIALGITGSLVFLYRNSIVYRVRVDILMGSRFIYLPGPNPSGIHVGYDALPSYDAMTWDITKWHSKDWGKRLPEGWEK